jgi:O-antigen/teichoic acid export membrane protein
VSPPGDLGRKSLLLVIATWAASALGFGSTLLVARRLGPEALGALGFGFGLVGVLAATLMPGFAQAHTKRVAEGRDLGRCLGTMGAIQLTLHGVLLGALVVAWPWWPLVVPAEVPLLTVVFLVAAQVLANFAAVFSGALLGREWAVAYASILVAGRGLRFVATVAVLVWTPDVRWVAACYPIEGAVEILLGWYVLSVRHGERIRWPERTTVWDYWVYAKPLLVTSPVGMLQDSLDRLLVARWAGLTAAGYYQVARALWEVLGTLNAYPFQLLFARLSRLFATRSAGQDTEARRLFASAVDRLLFMAVPAAFLLWALRSPVITLLYGDRFLPAAPTLMVFVVAALAQTALNPYHFVIYALDEHRRFVPVVLLRLVVYLGAMALAVPLWGGTGAAAVRLLLIVFPAWVFLRWTRNLAGIGLQPWTWLYVAGFAALAAVNEGGRVLLESLGAPPAVAMTGAFAFAGATYGFLLWAVHPGAAGNLRYAWDLIHPHRFLVFLRRSS